MKIIIDYEAIRQGFDGYKYLIRIRCQENEQRQYYPFMSLQQFCESSSVYLNVHKLTDENFYKENNIDYIVEIINGKEEIIPIGIVDFIKEDAYFEGTLRLSCDRYDNLHKINKIIDLIVRAIKIKYESITFIKKVEEGQEIITLE